MSAPRRRPDTGAPHIEVEPLRYREGDVIADKYRLDERLGEGGMGEVWRARNLALDVDVAIKLVHGDLLNAETTTRLRQEAHAAARLEHPAAVRVFDLGDTPLGDSFIVMELLRGRSLRDVLDETGPVDPTAAVALLLPVVGALVAAHAKGIVHRDLKPDNIMLVEGDGAALVPKVVDFGIAKVEAPGLQASTTAAGSILGSPEYMSPEQARGEVDRIDARSDVWSFGVVLFELVIGKPPFEAAHPLALLRAVIENEPATLEARGLAEPELSAIVARALAKNPDDRWPDMRSLGRALAEWAVARGVETDVTGVALATQWLRSPSHASFASGPDITNPFLKRPSLASLPRPAEPGGPTSARGGPASGGAPPERRRGPLFAIGIAAVAIGGAASAAALVATRAPARSTAAATVVAGPASEPARGPSTDAAPAATDPPAATGSVAPAASAAAAPATSAAAPPAASAAPAVDPIACVVALFPEDSFEPAPPLAPLCTERDPRRVAGLLRSAIARKGLGAPTSTEAMRTWALLSWYELAAVGFAQGACCGAARPTADLPPSVGACPDLAAAVDAIARAAHERSDLDAPLAAFRAAAGCVERGFRANPAITSPYAYPGPPGGGAETAFRRIAARAR